ncbi:MAG: Bug family tripartite tricarboxylate transporter substrate binding protein [Lautropia sp.]
MKTIVRQFAIGIAAAAFALGALADPSYPTKPVSLIIGFPPGGGNDVMGRLVAEHLRGELGQSVVVQNKPGADGAIAAELVANSPPDGYTLLSGSSGMMAYNPGLNSALRYSPTRDFLPVTMIGYSQLVFSVNPSLPVNSLSELVAYAKANPGKLFYASPSSPHRVAFEAFKEQTGADIRHVAYKGSGPGILAALSGEVQVLVSSVSDALQHARAGKLRPLAVTGTTRSGFMPDVPTAIESGVRFESASWIGLYAPKGTPPAIAERLYKALVNVMSSEAFKKSTATVGYEQFPPMTPAQFEAYQQGELTRWTKVIKDLNLQTQ